MPFAKYTRALPAQPQEARHGVSDAADLAQRLAGEPDLARRAAWWSALVALHSAEAVAALAGLLAHADPAVRACGADGLRQMPAMLTQAVLPALLMDTSPDMRIRALDAIDRVPDDRVEGWLIAMLERDCDQNVCGVVLDILADIGTEAALPAIRSARLRFANEPFIAFAAELALATIRGG